MSQQVLAQTAAEHIAHSCVLQYFLNDVMYKMDPNIIKRYLHSTVDIFIKNGFRYSGEIVHITDTSLIIIDERKREVAIDYDNINTIIQRTNGPRTN